jgi:hypothetical protein
LNNLVAVVHPQQQQRQHNKQSVNALVIPPTPGTKANMSPLKVVGKQQSVCDAHTCTTVEEASTAFKLKTTQHESKSEGEHSGKNEATNLNHEDVISPAPEGATTKLVSNKNCLTNDLRNWQDEKKRPSEEENDGFVDHESAGSDEERKQFEKSQEIFSSNAKLTGETTSGRNNDNAGPSEIRACSRRLSAAPCSKLSVADSAASVSLESSSLSRKDESTPTRETKSLTTKEDDENGQFVSTTDSKTAPMGSNSGGGGDFKDIKQHEKQQIINKCPSVRYRSALSGAHTRMPKLQQKPHENLTNSYKCPRNKLGTKGTNLQQPRSLVGKSTGKHEVGSGSVCLEVSSTKASPLSATSNLSGLSSTVGVQSINSKHLASKPMAHRVLSLMMLDAGLLPAGRDHPADEDRKGHVCLQSEPLSLMPNCLLEFPIQAESTDDNNNSASATETPKSNVPSQLRPDCSSESSNCTRYDDTLLSSSPGQHVAAIDLAKGLKQAQQSIRATNYNLFNFDCSKKGNESVSLPSSPRLSRANRAKMNIEKLTLARKFEHLNLDHAQLLDAEKSYQRAYEKPPPVIIHPTHTYESRISKTIISNVNFDIETQSTTSSSSSLNNHCPPMLALSNQLEFSQMIRGVSLQKVNQGHEHCVTQEDLSSRTEMDDPKIEVFPQRQLKLRPQPQSLLNLEVQQIQKTPRQIEQSNLVCKGSEDNLSTKIDRFDDLRQAAEKMRELAASGIGRSEFESNLGHVNELELDTKSSINPSCALQTLSCTSKIKSPLTQNEDPLLESQSR